MSASRVGRAGADLAQDLLELLASSVGQPSSGWSSPSKRIDRRLADLEMDVARAPVDGVVQEPVQIHAGSDRQTSCLRA